MKIKFINTVLSFFIPQASFYLAFLSQVKWPCRLGGGGGGGEEIGDSNIKVTGVIVIPFRS